MSVGQDHVFTVDKFGISIVDNCVFRYGVNVISIFILYIVSVLVFVGRVDNAAEVFVIHYLQTVIVLFVREIL